MQELYTIMRELLEVEYHQKSLRYITKMLETAYDQEGVDEKNSLAVSGINYYLTVLHRDLGDAISRLDNYIAENAKNV